MIWMKDSNGNWYCDGPVCTSSLLDPCFYWDKNDEGTWFPVTVPVSRVSSFPRNSSLSLAG